jgi:hypothetical protein
MPLHRARIRDIVRLIASLPLEGIVDFYKKSQLCTRDYLDAYARAHKHSFKVDKELRKSCKNHKKMCVRHGVRSAPFYECLRHKV